MEREGRAFWEPLIDDFAQSSLTHSEFSRSNKVRLGAFRYWLYKLRKENLEPGEPPAGELPVAPQAEQPKASPPNHQTVQALNSPGSELPSSQRPSEGEMAALSRHFTAELSRVRSELNDQVQDMGFNVAEAQRQIDLLQQGIDELQTTPAHDEVNEIWEVLGPITRRLEQFESKSPETLYEEAFERVRDDIDELMINAAAEHLGDVTSIPPALSQDGIPERLNELEERLIALERLELRVKSLSLAIGDVTRDSRKAGQITKEILRLQTAGEQLVDQELKIPLTPRRLVDELLDRGFVLGKDVARSLLEKLQRRRILILEGVPGTGKSELARHLATIFNSGEGVKFTQVSAYPEAGVTDSIGSMRMIGKRFVPSFGWLTEAVRKCILSGGNHWLILDEINRCDVSALLAPAMDALEPRKSGHIEHPRLFPEDSEESGRIPVPGTFRIIGTMNPFDRDVIFGFSSALDRRVGRVRIPPVVGKAEARLVDLRIKSQYAEKHGKNLADFKKSIGLARPLKLLTGLVHEIRELSRKEPRDFYQYCEIGTSVFLDMAERLCGMKVESENGLDAELVDHVVAEILLGNPKTFGRPALRVIRDEVLVPAEMEKSILQIASIMED